jgi:K+-sensing histidine kinase KdpD
MLLPIKGSGPRELAVAFGLVAVAGVAACVLRAAVGPVGAAMILLAPVVVAGLLYGVRTALAAAGLAYFVHAFLVPEPLLPSKLGVAGRYLTPPVFILAALIAGGFAPVLRASRRGAASWAQTTRAMAEATAFFNVTPNEDAIRQKLAETVSAMTRTVAIVTDRGGRLRFRAGAGSERTGPVEDELEDLVSAIIRQPQAHIVTRGEFCGRLIRTPGQVQGAVIWRRPRTRTNATDDLVELLADLAGAAIVRSGRETPVQKRS